MKDMFLAEELGYDPYEPYPPDENVLTEKDFLTEDDFKKQDSTLKISGDKMVLYKLVKILNDNTKEHVDGC